jgi:ribosomal protein S18 acetylase RimI-like enzyme
VTHVQVATTADLDDIVDMWVSLVRGQREHGAHLRAEPNRKTARDVLGRYVAADDLLVARTDSRVVGFAMVHVETGLYDQDTTRGIIDNLYVRPAARQEGVGTTLLSVAEEHLAEAGAAVVTLSVLTANTGAQRFYERAGYEPHRRELEKALGSDTDTSADGEQ